MKTIFAVSISAIALLAAAPVLAADLGSLKDDSGSVFGDRVSSTKSGFYITGTLGVAEGDRSISRTINREAGIDAPIPADATQAEIDEVIAELTAAGVGHGGNNVPGGNLTIPLIGDRLGLNDSDDFSSTVFGGEISYLYHPGGRFGFSLGAGATFYNDAESSTSHSGALGTYTGGTVASEVIAPMVGPCGAQICEGDPSHFSQSGALGVDRDYDIDVIGRVHFFATDRLAINVGAGVSFAKATLTGVNVSDPGAGAAFDTAFKEDDTSIGYVLTVGADYYLTDRITIGASYDYKRHDFEANASSGASTPIGGGASLYGKSDDRVEVEDEVHTLKAKIGFKLN